MNDKIVEGVLDFNPEHTGQYITLPVEIPENTEHMELSWSIDPDKGSPRENMVDFCVEDPEKFRGWTGYFRSDGVIISRAYATPGFLPGKIPGGTWNCRFGMVAVNCTGKIRVCIRCSRSVRRWYPGDLHSHTLHSSDGYYSVPEAAQLAKDAGLTFLALTDHNAQTQNDDIPGSSELLLIPSLELTTYKGHSNFWNLEAKQTRMICETSEDVLTCMESARQGGALVSMNHPFGHDRWHWGYDMPFDTVEVWNRPWSDYNEKALKWWHEELCRGRRLTAVGGSDTHVLDGFRGYGLPCTWIFSDGLTRGGLMGGIKAGRVAVSAGPKTPFPEIRIGGAGPGESCDTGAASIEAVIRNPQDGELLLISNLGIEKSFPLSRERETLHINMDSPGQRKFYRMEIRHPEKGLLGMCNPVYQM